MGINWNISFFGLLQVAELTSKLSELETGANRHQVEASELKVNNALYILSNLDWSSKVELAHYIHCISCSV